jgi:single-stranded-DNA-specific exonuclease
MRDAGIKGGVGVYEVGFILAPRINAMGRLEKALDSLRFLCTTNEKRAEELAKILNETNQERQKIVEEVVTHARSIVLSQEWKGVIVVNHETYHEGIIGLAASKIVEEFYRPTIVISQGELTSKASARSVQGFNIIENIRKVENLTLGGGGHPMAAGFSIETSKITEFKAALDKVSIPLLTEEVLKKRLVIDLQINFSLISNTLIELLKEFEPTGIANPTPVFMTEAVRVLDARTVGKEAKHLKLVLEEGGLVYDAIAFNMGHMYNELTPEVKINIAYTVEVNEWRNKKTIQLKVKDIVIK